MASRTRAAVTPRPLPVVREARVGDSEISVDRLLGLVRGPEVGGVALFVGVVRDHDAGQGVVSLDYTAHPSATQVLTDCADRVAERHDLVALAVEHRVGHLEVGDLAVVVAAGAVHRAAALAACTELIDDLKAQVPIWKEQRFVDGEYAWVGLPGAVGAAVGAAVDAAVGAAGDTEHRPGAAPAAGTPPTGQA